MQLIQNLIHWRDFSLLVPTVYSLLAEGLHEFVTATLIQYWAISLSSSANARTSSNKDFL